MKLSSDTKVKNDLVGTIAVDLKPGTSLDDFCSRMISNYNPDRFEAFAIRFYFGNEKIVTVYAIDKDRLEGGNFDKDKMPVKKFKLDQKFIEELFPLIYTGNFTLTTGNYPIDDMEVINK
jgi:hypothetical protein